MRDILRAQLRVDEGVSRFPYVDSVGKVSIGVGRNLDDNGLSDDEIELMLENDINDAEADARALLPNFDQLSDARKAVVCNMAFNLGRYKLSQFANTLRAIKEERWADAAEGMRRSRWAQQVGARAERLATIMEGKEPQ